MVDDSRDEDSPAVPAPLTEAPALPQRRWIGFGWAAAIAIMLAVRLWNVVKAPLLRGYDDLGHIAYILYLDLYRALPWADQGWSYFHPPVHYLIGYGLAQFDDPVVLLRGLSALGAILTLAIAAMAARVTRLANTDREDLALFAFTAVGLLPVYLYTSTMAGNELTAAFLGMLGLCVFVTNECREEPLVSRDALAGLAIGLALLTKVSAIIVLVGIGATFALRIVRERPGLAALRHHCARGLVLAGVALAVASPYYLRNVSEFGTPFKMSRDNPHVAKLESSQDPGFREWTDLFYVPAQLFSDPNYEEEHLLHSIWGSAFASMWVDQRGGGMRWPEVLSVNRVVVKLGLLPMLIALLGAACALRDVIRGRRSNVYVPMFMAAASSVAAFAYFAFAAPQFSALKASYLLGVTLPYAVFLARGIEWLGVVAARAGTALAGASVVAPALVAACVNANGVVLPKMLDHGALGALHFYFGRNNGYEDAQQFYEREREDLRTRSMYTINLGATALASGNPHEARAQFDLFRQKLNPNYRNAIGVATALSGEYHTAIKMLTGAIANGAGPEAWINRGVVNATLGKLTAARNDLLQAIARDPNLAPAWQALAEINDRQGRSDEAAEARTKATRAAQRPPRDHPYGIPDCFGQYPSSKIDMRWMLWLDAEELKLARAPYRPDDAISMLPASTTLGAKPNIALIVVDTLRADHLGAYGYPRDTSPRIDQLAAEGVRFANATATSSWTLPSMASLFTSLPVRAHEVFATAERIPAKVSTFVERLDAGGYHTVGITGNFVHLTTRAGFARGFDSWLSLLSRAENPSDSIYQAEGAPTGMRAPTAEEVNEAVISRLPPIGDQRLFLYVHYMDPHSGYSPPERHRLRFVTDPAAHANGERATSDFLVDLVHGRRSHDARERQRLTDLYDAEVATTDEAIGQLIDELAVRGFADNLVVVVTSDHGEELGDHGSWFHGRTLYGETLRVPIVIWDSRSRNAGQVRDEPVSLIDVPTTLLALAGIEQALGMEGLDLLAGASQTPRELVARLDPDPLIGSHLGERRDRRALLKWPWKVIIEVDGSMRVYDLANDPNENDPLALDDPKIPTEFRIGALSLAEDLAQHPNDPKSRQIERQLEREQAKDFIKGLRALGYAE